MTKKKALSGIIAGMLSVMPLANVNPVFYYAPTFAAENSEITTAEYSDILTTTAVTSRGSTTTITTTTAAVSEQKPLISENDIIRLSEKGDALTWSDFEEFEYTDIGSGLYIWEFNIQHTHAKLQISGTDISEKPARIIYFHGNGAEVDIRTEDMTLWFCDGAETTAAVTSAGNTTTTTAAVSEPNMFNQNKDYDVLTPPPGYEQMTPDSELIIGVWNQVDEDIVKYLEMHKIDAEKMPDTADYCKKLLEKDLQELADIYGENFADVKYLAVPVGVYFVNGKLYYYELRKDWRGYEQVLTLKMWLAPWISEDKLKNTEEYENFIKMSNVEQCEFVSEYLLNYEGDVDDIEYDFAAAEGSAEITPEIAAALVEEASNLKGDANCDGSVSLADAVLIMQSIANADVYGVDGTSKNHITELGMTNADVYEAGSGLTPQDALEIQKYMLKLISKLPE